MRDAVAERRAAWNQASRAEAIRRGHPHLADEAHWLRYWKWQVKPWARPRSDDFVQWLRDRGELPPWEQGMPGHRTLPLRMIEWLNANRPKVAPRDRWLASWQERVPNWAKDRHGAFLDWFMGYSGETRPWDLADNHEGLQRAIEDWTGLFGPSTESRSRLSEAMESLRMPDANARWRNLWYWHDSIPQWAKDRPSYRVEFVAWYETAIGADAARDYCRGKDLLPVILNWLKENRKSTNELDTERKAWNKWVKDLGEYNTFWETSEVIPDDLRNGQGEFDTWYARQVGDVHVKVATAYVDNREDFLERLRAWIKEVRK